MDFNPIEATPQERERFRRLALQWTLEEAEEDFRRLPGEPLEEFLKARDSYLRELEVMGPPLPREPCIAWKMINGQRLLCRKPRQLTLPFDELKHSP